jgi:hypothetical protein
MYHAAGKAASSVWSTPRASRSASWPSRPAKANRALYARSFIGCSSAPRPCCVWLAGGDLQARQPLPLALTFGSQGRPRPCPQVYSAHAPSHTASSTVRINPRGLMCCVAGRPRLLRRPRAISATLTTRTSLSMYVCVSASIWLHSQPRQLDTRRD